MKKLYILFFVLLLCGGGQACGIDSGKVLGLGSEDSLVWSMDTLELNLITTRTTCTLVVYSLVKTGYRDVSELIPAPCPDNKPGCCVMHWATLTKKVPAYDTVVYLEIPIPCEDKKEFGVEVR